MNDGEKPAEGGLALGYRVQTLEKEMSKTKKAIRAIAAQETETDYSLWINQHVVVRTAIKTYEGVLKAVGKFTIKIVEPCGDGINKEHIVNKGQIVGMSKG